MVGRVDLTYATWEKQDRKPPPPQSHTNTVLPVRFYSSSSTGGLYETFPAHENIADKPR